MTELLLPRYIDTTDGLSQWVERSAAASAVAVDTESDSFHHYREKVCLIQMTAAGDDAILDPLALKDLGALGPLFADPSRTKIFHDACYDLICLRRDFGFEVHGIFDTMLASRLLGERNFGLAAILKQRFGFEANKRLQRSDWTRRPLSEEQLAYARFDTHFLPELAALLRQELEARGRLSWALEEFRRLPEVAARATPRTYGPDPAGFWRMAGIRSLSPPVLGRVRALYLLREGIAERLDRPPFKVFGDRLLIDLATLPPESLDDFQPRPGLRRAGIGRFGREILQALKKATPVVDKPPRDRRPRRRSGRFLDPAARHRFEALRELRLNQAAALQVDPEVALGNAVLEDLARSPPATRAEVEAVPELQGWRAPLFIDPIFSLLTSDDRRR
ncbi:MAG: HRDC domain-containing protein [Deltaproteobacteria bacterium]|nr:HRDC domain-containing protein [Deltaproteobacteria bacterium]